MSTAPTPDGLDPNEAESDDPNEAESLDPVSPVQQRVDDVEAGVARMLSVGALVAVTLLVIGVVLMLAAGISPDSTTFPVFDPATVITDLLAFRPEGFLWAGILVVIATPIARVLAEAVGFGRAGERWLAAVAGGILAVIAASVLSANLLEFVRS